MPIVADSYRFVTGVDTHARTHTLVILDTALKGQVDAATFPATAAGCARAAAWLTRRTNDPSGVLVAMEGTNSYGAKLRQHLTTSGYRVVEAPAPSRSRRRLKGKSDRLDALHAAQATLPLASDRLNEPKAGEVVTALRILSAAREAMTRQRTAAINALTALLRSVELGIDARKPLTQNQIQEVASWRARQEGIAARVSRNEAVRLARLIIALRTLLAENAEQSTELVTDLAPQILDLPGVGGVNAAIILSSWPHPGRIRNEAAFAALAGTCPIPASSGNTVRHRLNRSGDRRLNRAIHSVAIVRMRCDSRTKAYVARRTQEGRTKKEITRCLKRYITREIYKTLNRPQA